MTLEPVFLTGLSGTEAPIPDSSPGAPRPTLFCDRDGTIISNRPDYVREATHTVPLPGAANALRRAADVGYAIVIVSNQSPIGRGLLSRDLVIEVHQALLARLALAGVPILGSFLCPHRPDHGCPCRKPRDGMLRAALRGFPVDRRRSAVIGDAIEDMRAAKAAGLNGVLVRTGRGATHADLVQANTQLHGLPIVADLGAAVELVYSRHSKENACAE